MSSAAEEEAAGTASERANTTEDDDVREDIVTQQLQAANDELESNEAEEKNEALQADEEEKMIVDETESNAGDGDNQDASVVEKMHEEKDAVQIDEPQEEERLPSESTAEEKKTDLTDPTLEEENAEIHYYKAVSWLVYPVTLGNLKSRSFKSLLSSTKFWRMAFPAVSQGTMKGVLYLRFKAAIDTAEKRANLSDLSLLDKSKPQTRPAHTQNITDDAMLEIFEKSFASGKREPASVFVNNIPTDAKLQILNLLFPSAASIQLPMGADGSNMGYAIVEFSSLNEARAIVKRSTLYATKIGMNFLNLHVIGEEEVEKEKKKELMKSESKSQDAKRTRKESGGRTAASGEPRRLSASGNQSVGKKMEIQKGYSVFIANFKRHTPGKEVMECLVKEMRERGICSEDENPIIRMKAIPFKPYQFAVFESPSKALAAIEQLNNVVQLNGQKLTLKEGQNVQQLRQETKGPAKDSSKDGTLNERQGRKESNQTLNRKRKLDGSVGRKDQQAEVKKPKVKVPPTKKNDSQNLSANGKPLTKTRKRTRGKRGQAGKQKQQAELKSNPSSKSTPQNKPAKSTPQNKPAKSTPQNKPAKSTPQNKPAKRAQNKQQTAVKSTSRNQSTKKSLNTGNQRSTSNSTPRNGPARRSLGNQRSILNSMPRNQPARRSLDNQRPSSHSTPRNQPARSTSNQQSSRSRDWAGRRSGDSSRNRSYNAVGPPSGGLSTLDLLDPLISEQILKASLLNSGLTGGNLLGGGLSTLGLPNPVLSGQNFPRDPSGRDYPDIARRENLYRNVTPVIRERPTSGEMDRRDRYVEAMDTSDRYHLLGATDPLYSRERRALDLRESRDLDPLYPRARDPLDSRAREPRDLDPLYPRARDPLDYRAREPRVLDPLYSRAHHPVDSRAMEPRDLDPYYRRETRDVDPLYLRAQDSLDSRAREPQSYSANNPVSMDMVGASQVQLLIDQLTKMERSGDLSGVGDGYDRIGSLERGGMEDGELLITNMSSEIGYHEIREFLNNEMKRLNMCGSEEMPLKWLDRFDRQHLKATFNTASQANYALQTLNGILYKGRPVILQRKTEEQKKRETGSGHIYVGNLPLDFDKKQLTDLVNKEFVKKKLCRPKDTPVKYMSENSGKPYGFLRFATPKLARSAIQHLNGLMFKGKQLRLGPANN